MCIRTNCTGPLAPVLRWLTAHLPFGWAPETDPRTLKATLRKAYEHAYEQHAHFGVRTKRRVVAVGGPVTGWRHVWGGPGPHSRAGELYGPTKDNRPPYPGGQGWTWERVRI